MNTTGDKKVPNTKNTARVTGPAFSLRPSRIAIVARDSPIVPKHSSAIEAKAAVKRARWKFGTHMAKILAACSQAGCDTIMFSPWTVKAIFHRDLFHPSTSHHTVVLGVGSPSKVESVEIWVRDRVAPLRVRQVFIKSSDRDTDKEAFIRQLPERVRGDTALMICGESNIVRIPRGTKSAEDRFQVLPALKKAKIRILLNPIHTYMRRYEMPLKRRALSKGRYVISLWNYGFVRGSESKDPWQIFKNEKDISSAVTEIDNPLGKQFSLRIGILDLS